MGQRAYPGVPLAFERFLSAAYFPLGGGEVIDAARQQGQFVVSVQRDIVIHFVFTQFIDSLCNRNKVRKPLSEHKQKEDDKNDDRSDAAYAPKPEMKRDILHFRKDNILPEQVRISYGAGCCIQEQEGEQGNHRTEKQIFKNNM